FLPSSIALAMGSVFLNSDDGVVIVYQSDDATDFRLLKATAYTPPSNRIRDASVFKHTNGLE
ncbi:hypothetical protein, partial [Serratia marcescens]|uniref:hypothetical protein n=1 Tax=Serratia marcescens TaxID=615 RepID=UPI0019542556